MWKKFVESIPNVVLTLIISLVTTLIVFSGNFAGIQAKVEANSQRIERTADKIEVDRIRESQDRWNAVILDRINQVDKKVDDIIKILLTSRRER